MCIRDRPSTCLSELPSQASHHFDCQSTGGNRCCVPYVFRLYRKPHHSDHDTMPDPVELQLSLIHICAYRFLNNSSVSSDAILSGLIHTCCKNASGRDVYNRQESSIGYHNDRAQTAYKEGTTSRDESFSADFYRFSLDGHLDRNQLLRATPVSYTHLDVYQRQIYP